MVLFVRAPRTSTVSKNTTYVTYQRPEETWEAFGTLNVYTPFILC